MQLFKVNINSGGGLLNFDIVNEKDDMYWAIKNNTDNPTNPLNIPITDDSRDVYTFFIYGDEIVEVHDLAIDLLETSETYLWFNKKQFDTIVEAKKLYNDTLGPFTKTALKILEAFGL